MSDALPGRPLTRMARLRQRRVQRRRAGAAWLLLGTTLLLLGLFMAPSVMAMESDGGTVTDRDLRRRREFRARAGGLERPAGWGHAGGGRRRGPAGRDRRAAADLAG
jgi:hypothetical protein